MSESLILSIVDLIGASAVVPGPHFSLPKRNPCTSSTGSFSPITVAFTSAPETTIDRLIIIRVPWGLGHCVCTGVCTGVCVGTLDLRVILRLVLLVLDSELHSVAGQKHFLWLWILQGKERYF